MESSDGKINKLMDPVPVFLLSGIFIVRKNHRKWCNLQDIQLALTGALPKRVPELVFNMEVFGQVLSYDNLSGPV